MSGDSPVGCLMSRNSCFNNIDIDHYCDVLELEKSGLDGNPSYLENCSFCILSIVSSNGLDLQEAAASLPLLLYQQVLSEQEIRRSRTITSKKRALHYILGRVSAKIGIQKAVDAGLLNSTFGLKTSCLKDISILNKENGAPYVEILNHPENGDGFKVSIAHTKNIAMSLIFKGNLICGIDIEVQDFKANASKINALKRMTNESIFSEQDPKLLTIAWALKEALIKTINANVERDIGSVPTDTSVKAYDMALFEISSVQQCGKNIYYATFRNFEHHHGVCLYSSQGRCIAICWKPINFCA